LVVADAVSHRAIEWSADGGAGRFVVAARHNARGGGGARSGRKDGIERTHIAPTATTGPKQKTVHVWEHI